MSAVVKKILSEVFLLLSLTGSGGYQRLMQRSSEMMG